MRDCVCEHTGHRVYTRRVFSNGSIHYCVQCRKCLALVRLEEHGNRPFIKAHEIPVGKMIYAFIDNGDGR